MRFLARTFTSVTIVLAAASLYASSYLRERALLVPDPAPEAWVDAAKPEDRIEVPGHDILYWGNPNARYSVHGTKGLEKPAGIVVHFTRVRPVLHFVRYGHARDFRRGGGSFGYHFYIGRRGGIVQGAPLSRRTNHIKSTKKLQRTRIARHLWNGNAIGISLVGGCDSLLRPAWRNFSECGSEFVTPEQLRSGLALIRAIQEKYDIPCEEVYGHGELQTDRVNFEGEKLTRSARASCPSDVDSS